MSALTPEEKAAFHVVRSIAVQERARLDVVIAYLDERITRERYQPVDNDAVFYQPNDAVFGA